MRCTRSVTMTCFRACCVTCFMICFGTCCVTCSGAGRAAGTLATTADIRNGHDNRRRARLPTFSHGGQRQSVHQPIDKPPASFRRPCISGGRSQHFIGGTCGSCACRGTVCTDVWHPNVLARGGSGSRMYSQCTFVSAWSYHYTDPKACLCSCLRAEHPGTQRVCPPVVF